MYRAFARVYDRFMENIPYGDWVELIEKIWVEHGLINDSHDICENSGKLILELGCGTGNVTGRLAEKGYDMIGIDNSQDMLSIAIQKKMFIKPMLKETLKNVEKNGTEKAENLSKAVAAEQTVNNQSEEAILELPGAESHSLENNAPVNDILYLCQDMRNFELYGTVDSIICICDGINYMTKSSDVLKVFRLVKNYLNPGGIFIFDIITRYRYRKILGENNFSEVNETSAFIWNNYFDNVSGINRYSVSFFIQSQNGLYERFDETHFQRAYSKMKIIRLLEEAGLELLNTYDETGGVENPRSERLFFAVKKGR